MGGELPALLSAADRALGRLDGSVLTLPNPDLFVFMYVRKEAVLSSQIEGTQSSLQDLLTAEAQLFDQNLPRDVDEVVNYVRAINHGLSRLPQLPVSVRLIREIHTKLMRCARWPPATRRVPNQPKLDRPSGVHPDKRHLRRAAAACGSRSARRP